MTNPDYRAMCAVLIDALDNLLALVNGECPSLLDGDRGGSGFLAIEIDDALTTARALLAEPVADLGEVAQVAIELQELAESCDTLAMGRVQRLLTRAATLLQQLSAPSVPN